MTEDQKMSDKVLSVATQKLYEAAIHRIEEQFGYGYTADEVIPWLQTKYHNPHTYKNYLCALMYVAKGAEYEAYHKAFRGVRVDLATIEKSQTLSDDKKEEFVPWEELQEMYQGALHSYKAGALSLDKLVLLALYTQTDPLRADFAGMKYIRLKKELKEIENGTNYCYLGASPRFILTAYKTEKTYGRRDIPIPAGLAKLLKTHKAAGASVVFDGSTNALIIAVRRLTKELTGKMVGVNLFRHARLTALYETNPSIAEKERVAFNMCHSAPEGERYRVL